MSAARDPAVNQAAEHYDDSIAATSSASLAAESPKRGCSHSRS